MSVNFNFANQIWREIKYRSNLTCGSNNFEVSFGAKFIKSIIETFLDKVF